jgi:dinuclear metal center YbgI/SA1388 family protein
MHREKILDFINKTLKVEEPGKDPWVFNGLQVVGRDEVKKIALGVSPNLEIFKKAADWRADMIVLHHGLFGPKRPQRIGKVLKNRLKVLFDNDITLLSYHLYLDNHPKLGNNAQIIKLIGAKKEDPFGNQEGISWGFGASFQKPVSSKELFQRINKICPGTKYFGKGKGSISSCAVVSGGGAYNVMEAIDKKFDAYITGEIVESISDIAWEADIHYYCLGHYNSEKFGIKALGKLLKSKFSGLEVKFIDIPNNL